MQNKSTKTYEEINRNWNERLKLPKMIHLHESYMLVIDEDTDWWSWDADADDYDGDDYDYWWKR